MATKKTRGALPSAVLVEAMVDLILRALDEHPIATRDEILKFAIKNRNTASGTRRGDLKPRVIREQLRMFLDKMTSGGRLGVAYFRRSTDR